MKASCFFLLYTGVVCARFNRSCLRLPLSSEINIASLPGHLQSEPNLTSEILSFLCPNILWPANRILEEPECKGTWVKCLVHLLRMRKSPASLMAFNFPGFASLREWNLDRRSLCGKSKSCALSVLLEIMSFLTVVFIQFLPSSHGHFSHVEVQTRPRRTCSHFTDTSFVRALAQVVPLQWSNTHFG